MKTIYIPGVGGRVGVVRVEKKIGGGGQSGCEFFTKYSTHHISSANTGFKSLAFILFEILHLQNDDVKFRNFQREITKKNHMNFFLKFHHMIYSLNSIIC